MQQRHKALYQFIKLTFKARVPLAIATFNMHCVYNIQHVLLIDEHVLKKKAADISVTKALIQRVASKKSALML